MKLFWVYACIIYNNTVDIVFMMLSGVLCIYIHTLYIVHMCTLEKVLILMNMYVPAALISA